MKNVKFQEKCQGPNPSTTITPPPGGGGSRTALPVGGTVAEVGAGEPGAAAAQAGGRQRRRLQARRGAAGHGTVGPVHSGWKTMVQYNE